MPRLLPETLEPRPGREVLSACLRLCEVARARGGALVFVSVERLDLESQPEGSGLAPQLAPRGEDIQIVKNAISAFHGTTLQAELKNRAIDTLVLAGVMTNLGVESTARAACDFGYELVFIEDAMAAFTREEHDGAVRHDFPRFGKVIAMNHVVDAS